MMKMFVLLCAFGIAASGKFGGFGGLGSGPFGGGNYNSGFGSGGSNRRDVSNFPPPRFETYRSAEPREPRRGVEYNANANAGTVYQRLGRDGDTKVFAGGNPIDNTVVLGVEQRNLARNHNNDCCK